jgi:hypothetical protein
MKKIDLLTTKEEIEKYGFVYEPDKSKCISVNTAVLYTTFTVNNGILKVYTPAPTDQYIESLSQRTHSMGIESVNSFWVNLPESVDDLHNDAQTEYHAHPRIYVTGHRKVKTI